MPSLVRSALSVTGIVSRGQHQHVTTANLLSPLLAGFQQCRNASILSSLSDNRGAYNKRIRRGRGPASGKGKTSGRGMKGQKAHGKVPQGFNGGQTPDIIVHGVRGFENENAKDFNVLNVSRIAKWIAAGRINPKLPITIPALVQSQCISHVRDGVKLLAKQDARSPLTTPIRIVVNRASTAAIQAVEAAGGQVLTRYYNATSLRRMMQGEVHPFLSLESKLLEDYRSEGSEEGAEGVEAGQAQEAAGSTTQQKLELMARYQYRLSDATGRRDMEYYRDAARRGYLAHTVKAGEGPNLYFETKSPKKNDAAAAGGSKKVVKKANRGPAERLW